MNTIYIFISGIIAFIICGIEMLFGKYKLNHTILLKKCKYLIIYCCLFAVISMFITFFIIKGELEINDYALKDSEILLPIIIGISIKSIIDINIYTLTIANKTIPIGPKIIVNFFEDFLEKKIQDDVDTLLLVKIKTVENSMKKLTLRQMDEYIEHILPTKFTQLERKIYMKEVSGFKSAFDKSRFIATKFGCNRLNMLLTEVTSKL